MSRIDDIARERAAEALHVYSAQASGRLHQPWAKTSEPTRDTWRAAVGVVVEAYNSQLMREIDEALMLTEGCATLKEMSAGWAEGTAAIARLAAALARAQAGEARAAMLDTALAAADRLAEACIYRECRGHMRRCRVCHGDMPDHMDGCTVAAYLAAREETR